MPKLQPINPSELKTRLFINGEWIDAKAGGEIEIINPFDGSVITRIAEARAEDVDLAVEAAAAAAPAWARLPAHGRRDRSGCRLSGQA